MAGDQNIAASLMQEALEDIQRNHLIKVRAPATGIPRPCRPGQGHRAVCRDVGFSGRRVVAESDQWHLRQHASEPVSAEPVLQSGVPELGEGNFLATHPGAPLFRRTARRRRTSHLAQFRVLYKLERHPNWVAGLQSFENIYVVTMTVYKDLNPTIHPHDPKKKLEQISDPMVVYLRAKVNQ